VPFRLARGVSNYRAGLGAGGRQFGRALVQGFAASWRGSIAPNITSNPVKGMGSWSDAENADFPWWQRERVGRTGRIRHDLGLRSVTRNLGVLPNAPDIHQWKI